MQSESASSLSLVSQCCLTLDQKPFILEVYRLSSSRAFAHALLQFVSIRSMPLLGPIVYFFTSRNSKVYVRELGVSTFTKLPRVGEPRFAEISRPNNGIKILTGVSSSKFHCRSNRHLAAQEAGARLTRSASSYGLFARHTS